LAGNGIKSGYRSNFSGSTKRKNPVGSDSNRQLLKVSAERYWYICLLSPVFLPQHPAVVYCGVNNTSEY